MDNSIDKSELNSILMRAETAANEAIAASAAAETALAEIQKIILADMQ
jgi:hypothetical protein